MADFYLDHNVATELVRLLRTLGHQAITARGSGMDRSTDDEQLLHAAERGSILITHNRADFILLHGAWRRWASAWGVTQFHAGILIVPQPPAASNAQIAQSIDAFLRRRPSLANELYLWRPASGWLRRT